MFRAAVLLCAASVVLTALALISCLSVEDRRQIRALPRWAWILLIVFLPPLGGIAYFAWGRPLPADRPRPGWLTGGYTEPPRPRAPDDDPEFLRSLDKFTSNARDEEHLRRWEEELKRREDEQRRRDRDT